MKLPIKPMLLATGGEPSDSSDRLFEVKLDGWRICIIKSGYRVDAYTRNGNCISHKFEQELREVGASIKLPSVILDTEGIVLREHKESFEDFSYRGRLNDPVKIRAATHTHPVSFVAFDVIETDKDLTTTELIERKQILEDIIIPSSVITPIPYVIGQASHLWEVTRERGMEGIVSKPLKSKYLFDHRSLDQWRKHKHWKELPCVILGYELNPFSIIVGVRFRTTGLKEIAKVEYGFKPEEKQAFRGIAKEIHTTRTGSTQWIEPRLVCNIRYQDRTDNHQLRTTTFQGFNFDKKPEECVWLY